MPIGLGPDASAVEGLPNGRWLEDPSKLADEVYKIMDSEFSVEANGRHGMIKGQPVWGKQLLNWRQVAPTTTGPPLNTSQTDGAGRLSPGFHPNTLLGLSGVNDDTVPNGSSDYGNILEQDYAI